MNLILILAGMYKSKIVAFGAQKTRKLIWSRGIIGPFLFENEQGEAVTFNADRYQAMLNVFLNTKNEEQDIGNIWFQQDGAT